MSEEEWVHEDIELVQGGQAVVVRWWSPDDTEGSGKSTQARFSGDFYWLEAG